VVHVIERAHTGGLCKAALEGALNQSRDHHHLRHGRFVLVVRERTPL
jgi:hypothetical protein